MSAILYGYSRWKGNRVRIPNDKQSLYVLKFLYFLMKVSHWETEKANIKMLSLLYIIRVRRPALILLRTYWYCRYRSSSIVRLYKCIKRVVCVPICDIHRKTLLWWFEKNYHSFFYWILRKRSLLMKKILSLILSFVLISSVNAFAVSIDDINSAISDTEKYLYENRSNVI